MKSGTEAFFGGLANRFDASTLILDCKQFAALDNLIFKINNHGAGLDHSFDVFF